VIIIPVLPASLLLTFSSNLTTVTGLAEELWLGLIIQILQRCLKLENVLCFLKKASFFKLTHCFKVASGLSKEINKKLIRPLLGVASEIDFRPEILSARVKGF